MKNIAVGLCLFLSTLAHAGKWVEIDLTSSSLSYSKVNGRYIEIQHVKLTTIPQVKISWFDEQDNLIDSESVIDPRAVWPLLEDGVSGEAHETVILTKRESFKFKGPDRAVSLDIEYLNMDMSHESRKVSF